MSPTLKRVLMIVGIIVVAALIGLGLYFAFFRKAPTAVITPGGGGEGGPGAELPGAGERPPLGGEGTIPGAEEGGLPTAGVVPSGGAGFFQPTPVTQLTSDITLYPSLNAAQGGMRYHNAADGKFYRLERDGNVRELVDQSFYNVKKVTWANNKDTAVIEYPDNSKIVYNFETKTQTTLPKHWDNFSFSADGRDIAAKSIGLSPENRWLVTTNDNVTETKLIEPLGNYGDKVTVNWSPSRQVVAFSQTGRPLGADRREILMVGLNQENFKSIIVEGQNFLPEWSPTGKKLLYSVNSARSEFKPELWITNSYGDEIGENRQQLQLNTWADKCTFADDTTLFCAVPKDLPRGAGMARDIAAGTPDEVYKVDLVNGVKTALPLGETNYHISSLNYDKQQNRLFFTDPNQNGIFEIDL